LRAGELRQEYRQTLKILHTCCFSLNETLLTWKRLNVTLCLSCWFNWKITFNNTSINYV